MRFIDLYITLTCVGLSFVAEVLTDIWLEGNR